MTSERDVASRLRAVSELRRLCLSLPHVPTPAERRLLVRFERLAKAPETAAAADVDAIAVGWRAWWRARRVEEIVTMARRVPRVLIDRDRRLATYAAAGGFE